MSSIRLLQNGIIGAAFGISIVMLVPPTSPLLSSPDLELFRASSTDPIPIAATPEPVDPKPRPEPVEARGLLMSGYTAGGSRAGDIVSMVERTELNTIVIDIKDEAGELSWVPESEWAGMAGAGKPKLREPDEFIERLKDKGIYVIGRIVTFQDPILTEARPDLAVQNRHGGGIWRNEKGLGWSDPYSAEAWRYNLEIAKEAVDRGFQEIQFDYIRFPTDGDLDRLWYRHRDNRLRREVIKDHLAEARRELEPLGVYVSADLFGLVTLGNGDMGIGQRLDVVSQEVDYVSPMIYPSHYSLGNYGLEDPEAAPYETMARSVRDAKELMADTGAILRPWIQDFSLRVRYGPEEVRAQIRALEDNGVEQWLMWNAANRYTEEALRPAGAQASR